jgi:hypothetical protein
MAITKFKITRLPIRADLKVLAAFVPLNQEYHISQQSDMTIDVSDRGVPYDSFGYKLGNDNGDWSPEYNVTVNALTDSGTPSLTPYSTTIPTAGSLDITANIVTNDDTDRFTVISITGNGYLILNDSIVDIGDVIFLYQLIELIFVSTASILSQNVVTTITLKPSNVDGDGANADIVITTTGNLHGSIVINDNDTDQIVSGTLTVV